MRISERIVSSKYKVCDYFLLSSVDDVLAIMSFCLFFVSDPVYKIVEFLMPCLDQVGVSWLSALVVYTPLMLLLIRNGRDTVRRIGWFFPVTLAVMALVFLISLVIHPEYSSKMFQEGWDYNILASVFCPTCGIYATLYISLLHSEKKIKKGLEAVALVNFLYCLTRLVRALYRGYWDGYIQTGELVHKNYSLDFGNDMMFSVLIFLMLAFESKNNKRYITLAALGYVTIMIGGNRAPLAIVFFSLIAMIIFYRGSDLIKWIKKIYTHNRLKANIFIVATVLLAALIICNYKAISQLILSVLHSMGVNSRSIESLLTGTFLEDNGRNEIYGLAINQIKSAPFFGYGAYGDRMYIGQGFFWGYPHNIWMEFVITFGIVPGTVLLLGILYSVIRALRNNKTAKYKSLIMLFSLLSVQLIISNSYLYLVWFWGLLALVWLQNVSVENDTDVR